MKTAEITRHFTSWALFLALTSCGGDNNITPDPKPVPPTDKVTVETPAVSAVGSTEVTLSSSYTANGVTITQKGFCYSTSSGPTLSDKVAACGGDDFNATVTGLKAGTEYYARAYVMSSENKAYYSTEKTFRTNAASGLDDYTAPSYADDYRSIADWSKRNQWNLANVHDPSVCLAEDGYYYMYQTDASFGNAHAGHGHFHGRRSKDLINWEYLGGTMPSLPAWVMPKLNEIRKAMGLPDSEAKEAEFGYWAPCVRKVRNGLYRMYYSIVVPGYIDAKKTSWGERAFIGLMETDNPANNDSWVDKGYVITNASDKHLNFYVNPTAWESCYFRWNAIDPSYIITPEGEHWLIYGSWHSGLVAVQLDAETGKVKAELKNPWGNNASDIAAYGKRIYTRLNTSRWQASEGPEIIYRDGWYYLFLAYDGLDVPYNTRVVRSRKVDGPYEDMYGTEVSEAGGDAYPILTHPYKFMKGKGWVGISHCAVFDDGKDNWYYSSQARFPNDAGGAAPNAVMLGHVRRIVWTTDGWPLVLPERYGAVPQVAIKESDIVGKWEHIDLSYKYAEQRTAVEMEFAADNTITSGPWKGGKWTYNEDSQILTANGVTLYLYRETDWEASPRTHTIVYAGLGNRKTYWGKKM
ncbi:MAG: arabinan endo-1,5-alpha-L-arabinosidase [Bacteroidales bacterium]|nr:arabinan endo-1,5-alpha-L-arabinosidase [Candidatus Hennigimonas equi]